jgi:glycosyltransferase involved in cell wall biosynthesis
VKPDVVLFNLQFATFGSGKAAAAIGLTAPALVKAAGYSTVVLLHNIMETVDLDSAGFADNRLMSTLIRAFGNITTRLLLRADLVALTIPKYVEILESKYKAENVILAPHGTFEAPPMPDFELPEGPMRVMTFGKFGTYKKVEELIEATDMLRSNGHPNVELVIAGSDSPNTPGYLENAAQVYEDVGGVAFTGYVPEEEVPRIFSESAVVVFPYTSTTGSSGVLHQAGGYGKAVVLPNIGDLSELITEEGYVGEFFEPASAESLRDAIARVLDDPERRVQMGRQNYLASCGLPIADVVDWYVLHMQELIKNKEG